MNSLETFTNQLIQHGTDLGAKLLSALVVLVIGLWLCRWVIRLVQHSRALDKLDPSLHTFLTSCTRIVLYVLLGLNVAGILGIQTTSFLTPDLCSGLPFSQSDKPDSIMDRFSR